MTGVSSQRIITLDGPAASGKSSAAKAIADTLDIAFVSSGLLYRAATYLGLKESVDASNESAVLEMLNVHEVELIALAKQSNRILIDGQELGAHLHTNEVDANVSAFAILPKLRLWVNERLQEVKGDFVIEGRDMGSVVFPQASHKFYLTASAAVRAKRRAPERSDADIAAIETAIKLRDEKDKKQLAPAQDAVWIDSSKLDLDEVVAKVLEYVQ